MRVLHVVHSLAVGGAEVLVHDFVRATRDRATHAVACLDDLGTLGEALRREGIAVDVIGRHGGIEPRVATSLRALARDFRADVVCAHQYGPYSYAAMAVPTLAPRPGLVFIEHGRHYPDFRRPKRVAINNAAFLRWTDRVVAVCGYTKRQLVENEGIPADRVEVVYNGVDVARYERAIDRAAARASLGLRDDDLAVTCVARIHPIKDHPTLVRAFARAQKQVARAKLVLVGGGDVAELRALASELGVTDRVAFPGERRDVPEVYAASDVFAMASLSEGTSVTLLEAMLSRLPAVVTDVGGNPEIVDRGQTGLLVPRGDAAALGDALAALLADPARRAAMGERARSRALRYFTRAKMNEAWLGVLADSVPARRSRAS